MRTTQVLVLLAILSAVGLAIAADTALADGSCLLSTTAPGAYAVRYWPDRIVLTYDAKADVAVTVHLPQAAKWARLDEAQLPAAKLAWDAKLSCATLQLPGGAHTVHVAWQGTYQKPAQEQRLPVTIDGKKAGELTARFTMEKMQADGSVTAPVGIVRASLRLKGKSEIAPALAVGTTLIDKWQPQPKGLISAKTVATAESTPLSLTIAGYGLVASPVEAIELQTVQRALEPKRLAAMPQQGLIIEAESFTGEGLGKAEVSDKHFETSGGKSIYQNSGDGHWMEYKFTVAQPRTYDLHMRAATQEPSDLRSIMVDGQTPAGLGLIQFPGTGGWGYSKDEWAAVQLTGIEGAPSLKLSAGEHTLRITGEGSTHLNLDYFVLAPR